MYQSKPHAPDDYPQRVRQLLDQLGLSRAEFARRLDVTATTVRNWEMGLAKPSPSSWQRILRAETLGVGGLAADPASGVLLGDLKAVYTADQPAPVMDFAADPEVLRAVAETHRLSYGYLYNPAFAAEISRVDPLPHQRLAVYEHMLPQPRLRFLLADDAGAGKTIMAGLYIREMLARRLVRRVLVVPPAGLVSNWERELRTLFNLSFRVITGGDCRDANPFASLDSNLAIVSLDTLAGQRVFSRLQEPATIPYDLAIFDEAHKLSADREPDFYVRKTDRYRLAEALAGAWSDEARWQLDWQVTHLLLLTATPHMGKDYPYYALWRLLEPQVLGTHEAFRVYPPEARARHILRRTKEEMVYYSGQLIYPIRVSDTLSYELSQGEVSEQTLYDQTTDYIENVYNRARMLNRSAARLAMSIFQRRMASSTYALLRSLERRRQRIDALIEAIRSGQITAEQLRDQQSRLDRLSDPLESMTADEESVEDSQEENEAREAQLLAGVVVANLTELGAERERVDYLHNLAQQVYDLGEDSKFARLREVIRDERFAGEKLIIFTEHRDTLDFLVRSFGQLGYTGQIAQIHGGMSTQIDPRTGLSERDEQVELFRKPVAEGGARILVATDAAGEGINLQFCWLMVNYDIPWNPARLEQRLGRIHRYKQTHDPVHMVNLVAGKTREGRVMRTLLDKLETIRAELKSDKVFDVVGRLFEGVSLADYMERVLQRGDFEAVEQELAGKLTKEQVQAIQTRERSLLGGGGDVRQNLPRLQAELSQEVYRHLLPGYVRRFVEQAAPLLGIALEEHGDGTFALRPARPGALDALWPLLERYPVDLRDRLTYERPTGAAQAIFLHPGEPVFDALQALLGQRYAGEALRGSVFVDAAAEQATLFHLALVEVVRQADPALHALAREELIDLRLAALRQDAQGVITPASVESLFLWQPLAHGAAAALDLVATGRQLTQQAADHAIAHIAQPLAQQHRQALLDKLPERRRFLEAGFDYQAIELASTRSSWNEKAKAGHPRAKDEANKIKQRQRRLAEQREEALACLAREPELIAVGEVTFLAHALVLPSNSPDDQKRQDAQVEAIAVQVATAFETARHAVIRDVSTPDRAVAVGLEPHPGYDMLSKRPDGTDLAIEVKGRAAGGHVEISQNEWVKACNLRDRYWLYVVHDCATPQPRLRRIQDPWTHLIAHAKGSMIIGEQQILLAAEAE